MAGSVDVQNAKLVVQPGRILIYLLKSLLHIDTLYFASRYLTGENGAGLK